MYREEHPNPQFERDTYTCLNGEWEFEIGKSSEKMNASLSSKIEVPFCMESKLSGIHNTDFITDCMYSREIEVKQSDLEGRFVLHFGAVDYKTEVYVNGEKAGEHKGGYTAFEVEITPFVTVGKNRITVVIHDDITENVPSGKQSRKRDSFGCFYTRVTGIWQTVWLEPVAPNHITAIKSIPNIDANTLGVTVSTSQKCDASSIVEVKLIDKGQIVASAKGVQGQEIRLGVNNPTLWSPENPYLYDMSITLTQKGKTVDIVKSYTAFRKISAEKDKNGIMRMFLNNKPLFQYGPLDQGWWPDGLYTAPTDEALLYDIKKTKDWGFNMIRKHIKVEPARWYYHCDKEGILVWQDMPSGDHGDYQWQPRVYNGGIYHERSAESKANYYREWKEIMDFCISNPSVVVWVPFNEAWGQFDTEKVVEWTENYDPSRLVNPASGGNHRACGDILDLHNYPGPEMYLVDAQRVTVLGEYGGIGLPLDGHLWWNKRNWGYIQFKDGDAVTEEYVKYANQLKELVKRGFSAAVYTQTTDVEGEVNGLMTYDRKVIKINEAKIKAANEAVIKAMEE